MVIRATRQPATAASHKSQLDSVASREIDRLSGIQRHLELTTRLDIIEAYCTTPLSSKLAFFNIHEAAHSATPDK